MAAVVTDFRSVLQDRLAQKQNQLGETEQTLKKYVGDGPPRGDRALGGLLRNSFNRPQPQPGPRRVPVGARLGPKLNDNGEVIHDDHPTPAVKSVMSRVIVDQKSRDEALSEQKQNTREVQRNRRMFGNLLGTLQRFRQDETKVKEREQKRRQVEQKIEEKTEKEKEEVKKMKQELFVERKKQKHEIRVLQVQMRRVEEYEVWESSKRREMQYIRTTTGPHHIYYLPKEHNDKTLTALEDTMDKIDGEIKKTKAAFEEDLLKIENKINHPEADPEAEEEEDEDEFKHKSVISAVVKAPSPQRRERRSTGNEKTKEEEEENGEKENEKVEIKKERGEESKKRRLDDEGKPPLKRKRSNSRRDDGSSSDSDSSSGEERRKMDRKRRQKRRENRKDSSSDSN